MVGLPISYSGTPPLIRVVSAFGLSLVLSVHSLLPSYTPRSRSALPVPRIAATIAKTISSLSPPSKARLTSQKAYPRFVLETPAPLPPAV
ncbi:hypothetical protein RHMOL_Rhmol05G0150400 [Rhododendron molle]|uniref:Uncharacterized protein n=1 Tax=Rhododendron molle TaxID=49168 RepID=A0ACC0NPJ8_RHOML|nr:hypothetical protein RHMOL_Rhmol05G0150400 [Rhododendron molle]